MPILIKKVGYIQNCILLKQRALAHLILLHFICISITVFMIQLMEFNLIISKLNYKPLVR